MPRRHAQLPTIGGFIVSILFLTILPQTVVGEEKGLFQKLKNALSSEKEGDGSGSYTRLRRGTGPVMVPESQQGEADPTFVQTPGAYGDGDIDLLQSSLSKSFPKCRQHIDEARQEVDKWG